MMYLQATLFPPLILEANDKGTSLYIDGKCDVHADIKGLDGIYVAMGTGAVCAYSTKNKINTISLTETEVIPVSKKIPRHL